VKKIEPWASHPKVPESAEGLRRVPEDLETLKPPSKRWRRPCGIVECPLESGKLRRVLGCQQEDDKGVEKTPCHARSDEEPGR